MEREYKTPSYIRKAVKNYTQRKLASLDDEALHELKIKTAEYKKQYYQAMKQKRILLQQQQIQE